MLVYHGERFTDALRTAKTTYGAARIFQKLVSTHVFPRKDTVQITFHDILHPQDVNISNVEQSYVQLKRKENFEEETIRERL